MRVQASRRRPPLVAMLALALLGGCKSWHTTTVAPRDIIQQGPRSVRVTNGTELPVTIRNPMIRNDSIVTPNTNPPGIPSNSTGVPYSAASTIEVARFSPVKTGAFVAGALVGAVTWARVVGTGPGGSGEPPDPVGKLVNIGLWSGVRFVAGLVR